MRSSLMGGGLAYAPARAGRREFVVARVREWPTLLAPLTALAAVGALGAAEGGYFPREWSWSAIGLLWIAFVALGLRSQARIGRFELVFLAGLTAFVLWVSASVAWSEDVPQTVSEIERSLVYLGGAVAVLALAQRRSVGALLGAVLAAITGLSAYGLATRLFPERLGSYNPIVGYRLSEPLGYWNALGIFAGLGILLALGFAARGRTPPARALAAASLPLLLPALYFTYSRGAWIALVVGALAAVALDPRRLQLITTALVIAPIPAVALWLSADSDALTRQQARLADASAQGHRLAFIIVGLALAAAVLAFLLTVVERRVTVARSLRTAFAATLVLVAAAGLVAVSVRYGNPATLARKAYDGFKAPPAAIQGDLNQRLFNLSGSGRANYWSVAWDDYGAHPVLGSGAGSFEQHWYQHRSNTGQVRDAHNLYLETLAELGPLGLALLMGTLALPLVAAARMRAYRLAAPAAGAYFAYLVHAGADWDWEVPAVTLAALFVGAALLVAAREEGARLLTKRARTGAIIMLAPLLVFAFVGLLGNAALRKSVEAAETGNWETTESEARAAMRWAPWAPDPWRWVAEAQLARNDLAGAQQSFHRALAKDPGDWGLWYGLALASTGTERQAALAHAAALNPRGSEIARLRADLGGSS